MNEKLSYDAILDLLVGDLKTEESLASVLNFLEHAASVIRLLHLSQGVNQESKKKII